jgi:hypothetical protein
LLVNAREISNVNVNLSVSPVLRSRARLAKKLGCASGAASRSQGVRRNIGFIDVSSS